jgi:hypothetical protein
MRFRKSLAVMVFRPVVFVLLEVRLGEIPETAMVHLL